MSELIFFILGCVIGSIAGAIYGGIKVANYIGSLLPSNEELEELKRDIGKVDDDAKATTKAMH